jgi:non-homologous end joining protein Ku
VRQKDYFDDIAAEKIHADMLELRHRIVESKSGQFMPQTFEDGYALQAEFMRNR